MKDNITYNVVDDCHLNYDSKLYITKPERKSNNSIEGNRGFQYNDILPEQSRRV